MKHQSFRKWFIDNGEDLLRGWLRTREDNELTKEETFGEWVDGEFGFYCEDPPEDYEIPYHGLLDQKAEAKKVIFGKEAHIESI